MDEDQTWVGTLPHICSNDVLHLVFSARGEREPMRMITKGYQYGPAGATAMFTVFIKGRDKHSVERNTTVCAGFHSGCGE